VRRCNRYLAQEIASVRPRAYSAGRDRPSRVLMAPARSWEVSLPHHAITMPRAAFDSYHCSRYNTRREGSPWKGSNRW